MTIIFTGIGIASAASGAAPTFIATTAAMAAGDFIVGIMAYDNSGGGGADPVTGALSITCGTGGLGSPATLEQSGINDPGSASAGLATRVAVYPVTGAIGSGTQITVSWTGTVAVRAIALMKVSSDAGTVSYRTSSGATGTNTVGVASVTHTSVSVSSGEGILYWVGHENGAAITGDGDTSAGTWNAVYGTFTGSGVAGMAAYFQAKTVTAGATQTWNISGASSDWIDGYIIFTETIPPSITQAAYRFYNDGTESGSVEKAAQDTALPADITLGDMVTQLRVRLQLTTAIAAAATDDWQLQYQRNSLGWVNVTTSSSVIVAYASASLTDAGTIISRLGAGTGTYQTGEISETGLVTDRGITASNYTELLYSIKLIAADVVANDIITFRVLYNGAATRMTYAVTPTINAGLAATITIAAYRWYNDDGSSNPTGVVAQDTPYSTPLIDRNFQLRVRIQNTDVGPVPIGTTYTLQMRVNAGAWGAAPMGSSAYINSTWQITSLMTGGVGSNYAGWITETVDTITTTTALPGNSHAEFGWVLAFTSALYTGGEQIEFRVLRGGSADNVTYAVTPTLSIITPTIVYFGTESSAKPGSFAGGAPMAKANGTSPAGWRMAGLLPTRGAGVETHSVATVAGNTNGVEVLDVAGLLPMQWVSPPIDRNVTLGTISVNIWGFESDAAANASMTVAFGTLDMYGTNGPKFSQGRSVELNTTSSVQSFTLTGSTYTKGDRICVRIILDDAPTLVAGYTASFRCGSPTPGVDGDSYISFVGAEFGFMTEEPTGSIFYLGTTALNPNPTGFVNQYMLPTRGSGVVTSSVATSSGVTSIAWKSGPLQYEWSTRPLNAFTLSGLVRVNIRCSISNVAANVGLRVMLGVADYVAAAPNWMWTPIQDAPTPWTGTSDGLLPTTEGAIRGWLAGPDLAVAQGQQLRLVLQITNLITGPMVTGHTAVLAWNGTAAGASGDSWIQLSQTVTQGAVPETLDTAAAASTGVAEIPAIGAPSGITNLEGIVTSQQIVLSWSEPTGSAT